MTQKKEPLGRRVIIGMFAMAMATFVIANDFVAFSVALPTMERDLHASVSTIQWIINAYTLVFGVLIVSGGRMADMYGRRRMFLIGSAIFAGFSVIAGLAPEAWMVIGCRALMGIGGALMWPATLGMTYALLPAARAGLAGGLIIGTAGFGNSVGPLLGGALTDLLSWRWIFFINLPIAGVTALVVSRVVKADTPDTDEKGFDYRGVALVSIALLALLLALDMGIDKGWTNPLILTLFGCAFTGLLVFALAERKAGAVALVPKDVLGNRSFFAAGLCTLLMSAIFFAAALYLPQLMTKELHYSALKAGVGFLPMMATFASVSFLAGSLYERLGAKISVCSGAVCLGAGMFLLSGVQTGMSYADLVPGMVVLGAGIGLFYSSVTTAAITSLDPARASLGGAIIYMFQIAGGSIGLGLNTAIVLSTKNFADGVGRAFQVNGLFAVAGLIVALLFVGGRLNKEVVRAAIHRHRAHA